MNQTVSAHWCLLGLAFVYLPAGANGDEITKGPVVPSLSSPAFRSAERFPGVPSNSTTKDLGIESTGPLAVRMPAEFEHQQTLYLSCGDFADDEQHAQTVAQIAHAARQHLQVNVLISNDQQQMTIQRLLRQKLKSMDNIAFIPVPHDTKWIRDFGPTLVRQGNRPLAIDWAYKEGRPSDDLVPLLLAELNHWSLEVSPLLIEGGNLLTNGIGLCLTTSRLIEQNTEQGINEVEVRRQLRGQLGIQELLVLEPLRGELTGHIDMFVTFADPTTVLVGQYSKQQDPLNAELLDRNAARLAKVMTPRGRLTVVRIPMGKNSDGLWRTYTNCIYANRVVLVPTYEDKPSSELKRVIATYRRLLPGWEVVPINSRQLIEDGGALHCISLTTP